MNQIVFAMIWAVGILAVGFALGESHVVKRYQAEADCPPGNLHRKVVDLERMEVRCHYYKTPGEP